MSSPRPVKYITVRYNVVRLRTDTKRHAPVEQLLSSHMSQIAMLRAGFSVKEPSTSLHSLQRTRVSVLTGQGLTPSSRGQKSHSHIVPTSSARANVRHGFVS